MDCVVAERSSSSRSSSVVHQRVRHRITRQFRAPAAEADIISSSSSSSSSCHLCPALHIAAKKDDVKAAALLLQNEQIDPNQVRSRSDLEHIGHTVTADCTVDNVVR